MLRNTNSSYGLLMKCFHWLAASLVVFMLILGLGMQYVHENNLRSQLYSFHKSLGIIVIALAALWVIWAAISTKPTYVDTMPKWQRIAAYSVHGLLYISIIVMPMSGWIMSSAYGYPPQFFGLFTLPNLLPVNAGIAKTASDIHEVVAWSIVILLSLHILAALKHQFIEKDNILKRMWF